MNKTQAAKKKADWLAYCLSIGWEKKELDDLSKVWDDYYDEEGNRRSRLQSPSTPILGAEEAAEELWDEYSELIDDDISSLETVAGNCIIREHKFKKAIIAHSEQYRERVLELEKGLLGILQRPHGCRFCDSGVLRTPDNPSKDHDDDCPYKITKQLLNL